ncbi:MAG TPA: hypothetical protein VMU95_03645 [Trebonia sp.]|nr:hypothetical protein [Trebonia sp.]
MIASLRRAALVGLSACALIAAGCGSRPSQTSATSRPSQAAAATSPLATSLTEADRAWAVVVMGGSASQENDFWQLFALPRGSSLWSLATPPAVADNGGLVAAADAGSDGRLAVAFRPSQDLTFSPLASTTGNALAWTPGLLDASIAAVPDALASRGPTMLALLTDGAIDQSATSGATWTTLASPDAIASSPAGARCQATALTAVSLTASGTPLAAAACARAGSSGIFAYSRAGWQAAGPAISGPLTSQPTRVLRLTSTSAGNTAVLAAGTGRQARLYAAWTAAGSRWSLSPAFPVGGAQVRASGTGAGGLAWVMLSDGHALTISGPGGSWRVLPALPAGTAALAGLPGGRIDALAVAGGKLTVYRLASPRAIWAKTQVIKVPIQYGSSS